MTMCVHMRFAGWVIWPMFVPMVFVMNMGVYVL
jgi:hypothetical protein